MAYSAPTVSAAGLTIPSFNDIQQALLDAYQGVYGSTTYLGNDDADYQWISAVALKLNDNCNLCQLDYNSRSPLTAIGAALDSIVKLNGLTRKAPVFSTATILISGTPRTNIFNGAVQDENGILWYLPTTVTIPTGGSISVVATCGQSGPVSADSGTITIPASGITAGWTGATNPVAAVVGTVPESDSQLRARQSVSVALPSNTRLAGTISDLLATSGVTRINVLENQTSVTDGFGNAAHSLTAVVEGGVDLDVATAIYNNKGIGCNTLGAAVTEVVVPVTDPNTGNITDIGFVRPTYVPIYVILTIHGLTSAFNSTMQTNIIAAVVNYLQSLQIGETVTQSALYGAALSVMANLAKPDFSIRLVNLGTSPSPSGTSDITMNFYDVAEGITANVSIVVV